MSNKTAKIILLTLRNANKELPFDGGEMKTTQQEMPADAEIRTKDITSAKYESRYTYYTYNIDSSRDMEYDSDYGGEKRFHFSITPTKKGFEGDVWTTTEKGESLILIDSLFTKTMTGLTQEEFARVLWIQLLAMNEMKEMNRVESCYFV